MPVPPHRVDCINVQPLQHHDEPRPPSGPLWVHEIKHDGYRLMVRRDGERVRCFTRNGHDWADRFLAIVEAALRIQASSFLIDGEAVIPSDDGTSDFPRCGDFFLCERTHLNTYLFGLTCARRGDGVT